MVFFGLWGHGSLGMFVWRVLIGREYGSLVVVHVFLSILAKIHLHANKHQHLWNLLELSPSTMLDVPPGLLLCGIIDGKSGT